MNWRIPHGNTLYLMLSSGIFMVSGYLINLWLGRELGPVSYGIYGVIISLMTAVNIIQTAGLPQATSKFIASGKHDSDDVLRASLLIQVVSTLVITIIYFLLAKPIALLLNDITLINYIRASSLILPFYSIFALYVSYFNGLHRFKKQAAINIAYSVAKLILVIALVYVYHLYGAIAGFIFSPLIALFFGFRLPGKGRVDGTLVRSLVIFSIPLIGFAILSTLQISVDLFFVKGLLTDPAAAGLYNASQNIARIPFYALGAFSLVLFPTVAKSITHESPAETAVHIRKTFESLLIFLIPITVLIALGSRFILRILYSAYYESAFACLSLLVIGLAFMTVFSLCANILIAANRPRLAMIISAVGLVIIGIACYILVPSFGINGAAIGTTIGCFVAMIIGLVYILRMFPGVLSNQYIPENSIQATSRVSAYSLVVLLIAYIALANTSPLGTTRSYALSENTIEKLGPESRVEIATTTNITITKQKDDLIYFSTPFPFNFDTAVLEIAFKNPVQTQPLEVGFKDRDAWHYKTELADIVLAHHPEWKAIGTSTVLYQKEKEYTSVEDFLAHPPQKVIGTFDYNLSTRETTIPDYEPSDKPTVIDSPLRGPHTMYVYVKDEPFYMKIVKQDLNWYVDADAATVEIYREEDRVFTVTFGDDGVVAASRKPGMEEVAEIRNPGPELPEPGVYKIVINSSQDSVIKRIETNLHKIVFAGPIYPISNSEIYRDFASSTKPTILYTNSNKLTAVTYHDASTQVLSVNNSKVSLRKNSPQIINLTSSPAQITVPKSNVVINGIGYFAFTPDQLFLPNPYRILPISTDLDLSLVDYVLDQQPAITVDEEGFSHAVRTFDVSTAVPEKGKLNWVVRAQGLKENGNEVLIRNIRVHYSKKGWWNK
jgi:stage V sporulation protein B